MRRKSAFLLIASIISAAVVAVSLPSLNKEQDGRKVSAQSISAEDGKAVYEQHCLACHGIEGRGSSRYPSLNSDSFKNRYRNEEKLLTKVSRDMPDNAPGTLTDEEYAAVTKYLLELNGVPTSFEDIDSHWAKEPILALFEQKILDGYPTDGKLYYKPDQNITRAEFIRYLVKAKDYFLYDTSSVSLTDIDKSKDKVYITTAIEYKLVDGYPDGTFRPNQKISRAEIAAILSRSEGISPVSSSGFHDVGTDHWAAGLIGALKEAKLFDGFEDGSFRPANNFTRAEAAAVIYRLTPQ